MHRFRLAAPRTTVRLAVLIMLAWVGLAMAASSEDVTFVNGDVRIAGTLARTSLELNAAADWDGLEALLRDTVRQQLAAMPEERRAQFGEPDQAVDAILATAMTQQRTWQHWFLGHDAAADWREVRVPALVIFGGRDVQVDLDLHRAALDAALADMPARARDRITVMVLPEANHLFQRAASGGVQEYGALPPDADARAPRCRRGVDGPDRGAERFPMKLARGWCAAARPLSVQRLTSP